MKRCIAAVYAISVGSDRNTKPGRKYTDEDAHRLVETIPALIEEINRLTQIEQDTWVQAYIKARNASGFVPELRPLSESEHG